MRWRYVDPLTPELERERAERVAAVDAWWEAFSAHADRLDQTFAGDDDFEVPPFMRGHLRPIHPGITGWEFGPALIKEGHRLVITPEAHRELRPFVDELVARAPDLPRWEFYSYRVAEPERVHETISGRVGVEVADLCASLTPGRFRRIDCTFSCADADRIEPERLQHLAFVAAETIFGERALDHWVGVIEGAELDLEELIPLPEILTRFETLQREQRALAPEQPYHAWVGEAEHTLLKLEPPSAPDYVAQDDLLSVVTADVELWEAAWSGAPFASERFSRNQEVFTYLKLELPGDSEQQLAKRREIEGALSAVLEPAGLAGVFATGLGRRYAYLYLALTDVESAWQTLAPILRDHEVPRRSWLLFCDTDLCGEWLAPWPDAPPPPQPEAEAEE